uniref:CW-type domain-containing protein n=1 Tax=Rhizochromulina marina TaxID=1034831 RepID=A0A7S2SC77_9STRA|mmetsp:Transcript_28032/g.82076  ORF Transcript_28032/g.82076 Transcript_28032/m.82076 type:complete len:523 (+) Transcript_28032:93-1661(+)
MQTPPLPARTPPLPMPSDYWVRCDSCEKWRKLGILNEAEQAAIEATQGWTCGLNHWDSSRSCCDVPEETWAPPKLVSRPQTSLRKSVATRPRKRKRGGKALWSSDSMVAVVLQRAHSLVVLRYDSSVHFSSVNPYKPGTTRWQRYERYKTTRTVQEAVSLGAKLLDLKEDCTHEYLTLLDVKPAQPPKAAGVSQTASSPSESRTSSPRPGCPATTSAAESAPGSAEDSAQTKALDLASRTLTTIDRNLWHIQDVQSELQQMFMLENKGRACPKAYRLSPDAMQSVGPLAHKLTQDWDSYLQQNHPGFSSFISTVGPYNGGEQLKQTRIVGPSQGRWEDFTDRYPWFSIIYQDVRQILSKHNCRFQCSATSSTSGNSTAPLPEIWDMHILRQGSDLGGAVFSDHQDRHAEVRYGKELTWTVTLVIHAKGPTTGLFMWNASDSLASDAPVGVVPYEGPGTGVIFPSMAWHRSITPAQSLGSFEAIKLSMFFVASTSRSSRYAARASAGVSGAAEFLLGHDNMNT